MEICQESSTNEDGEKGAGGEPPGRTRGRGRGRGRARQSHPAGETPSPENKISSCQGPGEKLHQGAAGGTVVSRGRGRGRKKPDQVLYIPRALRGKNDPKTSESKNVDTPETNVMKTSTLRDNSREQNTKSVGKGSHMDALTDGQHLSKSGDQELVNEGLQGKDCVKDSEQQIARRDAATCTISDGAASGREFDCPLFTGENAIAIDRKDIDCAEKSITGDEEIGLMAVESDHIHIDSKAGENSNMECEESNISQIKIITSEEADKDLACFEEYSPSSGEHRHETQDSYPSDVQVKYTEDNSTISHSTDLGDHESSLSISGNTSLSTSVDHPDGSIVHNVHEVQESTGAKSEPLKTGDDKTDNSTDITQGKDVTKLSSVDCEEQEPKRSITPDKDVAQKLEESMQSDSCMDHEEKARIPSPEPDSGSEGNLGMISGMNDEESSVTHRKEEAFIDSVVPEKEHCSSCSGKEDSSQNQISIDENGVHAAEESVCSTETKTDEKAKKRKTKKGDEKESRKKSKTKEEKKKKKEKKGTKEENSPKHSKHVKVQKDTGSKAASKTSNEESGEGSDDWDANFNDDGECLNPELLEQLHIATGIDKPIVQKTSYDYYNCTPAQAEVDEPEYEHIVEIHGFSSELKTQDLTMAFSSFRETGFDIKWVDDTHALGVFTSKIAANEAIKLCSSPLLKVRPLSQGIPESKQKARACLEFLQPYKERPKTTKIAANRMIAGALGIQSNMSREDRQKERAKLKEAQEQKRKKKQQKADAWGD